MNKKKKFPLDSFELRLILPVMIIVTICVIMINPVLGFIVGGLAWMLYKKFHNEISTHPKTSEKEAINKDTDKLIQTLVKEKEAIIEKPFENPDLIKKGSLPTHIHEILDEMQITTWTQLSVIDEKELLYEKCFGEEALTKLKAELAQRGLSLNGVKK